MTETHHSVIEGTEAMSAIHHVVEYFQGGKWQRHQVFAFDRAASECRREVEAAFRRGGDPNPRVRIRMGDPDALMKTMNEGRL